MKPEYEQWIAENIPAYEDAYGKCKEWTHAMATFFPELTPVRGFYFSIAWGERQHWWCKTPEGEIVDPTAKQFPCNGAGTYTEYDGRPLPTNPCANCSGPVYDGDTCCSDECRRDYVAYVTNEARAFGQLYHGDDDESL